MIKRTNLMIINNLTYHFLRSISEHLSDNFDGGIKQANMPKFFICMLFTE